jgi:hypothetical protein
MQRTNLLGASTKKVAAKTAKTAKRRVLWEDGALIAEGGRAKKRMRVSRLFRQRFKLLKLMKLVKQTVPFDRLRVRFRFLFC